MEQTSQAHASEPAAASERDQQAAAPVLASVAAMGAFLCAALAAALALRRRHQLARRAPGRRIVQPEPESVEFENSMDLLAAAVPEPPEEATQATAMFGEMAGEPVLCDLEEARTTVVCGPDELAHAVLAAATTGLVLQPWSMGTDVVVAGDMPWITALDEPQVRHVKDVEAGVVWLERTAAARRVALQREGLAEVERRVPVTLEGLRADPDRYEAWAPQVLVLAARPDDDQWLRVRDALAGQSLGLSVLCAGDESFPAGSMVTVLDESRALLDGEHFIPHLVDPTARRALVDLFETAASDATTPAPWWSQDDDLPPNLALLQRRPTLHTAEEAAVDPSAVTEPTLYLLGPVELLGCRGQPPARARRQCVEYCAWIHENPGLTSSAMSRQLLVAEGTRRSNMSRLRTWLGTDPNGELYLPDAYSGRIQLHPAVTSDWEHLQLLVAPGVNRCSTDSLVDALSMVRGAPLADAAPGQWHWAEELRTDMVSTIRDIGVVLAHRAITDGEPDLARWAATRALAAAPEDERLMCAWIRTEHLAGNQPEVERLVLHVTRAARNLGIDLSEETVEVMQQVMEGRRRAQRAW